MIRNRTTRPVKNTKPTAKDNLIKISSAVVYGLKFFDSNEEITPNRTFLKCKPTVVFDGTNLFIDYSSCKSQDTLHNLNHVLEDLKPGETFTLSDALYQDPTNSIETNISGTYTFMGVVNGNIVKAINETITLPSNITRFEAKNFSRIPQITITSVTNITKTYGVKNIFGEENENSFKNLGVEKNYYVEFSGNTNKDSYKVKDILIRDDGSEVLILDKKVVPESIFTTPVVVNVLVPKSIKDANEKQFDELRIIRDQVINKDADRFETQTEALARATYYRCSGYHQMAENGTVFFMPCTTHAAYEEAKSRKLRGERIGPAKTEFTGPISVDGYYPLYTTAQAAIQASPSPSLTREGETTVGYHTVTLRGKTFFVPNGLVTGQTYFEGDYYAGKKI